MSKIKEQLLKENDIKMQYYAKFMEFVCDQILDYPKGNSNKDLGEVKDSRSHSIKADKTITDSKLNPANNEDYNLPRGA